MSSGSSAAVSVVHPLDPKVFSCLFASSCARSPSETKEQVLHALSIRVPLARSGSRVIVSLSEDVVVKVGHNLGVEEVMVLQFLQDNLPTVVAPRHLGYMTIGPSSFMFLTRLPGESLEQKWSTLNDNQKLAVQAQLNSKLLAMRKHRLPEGMPMGTLSDPPRYKDTRMYTRVSSEPIYTEAQFNDWVTHSDTSRASASYRKWVRSMMRLDHSIVFTHADLHRGNIIVDTYETGELSVGIIDRERAGFYPEYWELLKALNTRAINDASDWWDFLPPSIQGYNFEVVMDRMIERTLL